MSSAALSQPPFPSTAARSKPLPVGEDIAFFSYSRNQHKMWEDLFAHQINTLQDHAADEFLSGLVKIDFDAKRIPALSDLSRQLNRQTGWRTARAPGPLSHEDLCTHLAQRILPCIDLPRECQEFEYTAIPDCFHDIFGIVPMLFNSDYARFLQKIAQVTLTANEALKESLGRMYHFSIEQGLIRNPDGLRLYGASLLTNPMETLHCREYTVSKFPFSPEHLADQPVQEGPVQNTLFAIESFEELECEFDRWAREHYLI